MSKNEKREAAERLMDGIRDIRDEYILEADVQEADEAPASQKVQRNSRQPWIEILIGAAAILLLGGIIWGILSNREKKESEETVTEAGSGDVSEAETEAVSTSSESMSLTESETGKNEESSTGNTAEDTHVEKTTGYPTGLIQRQYLFYDNKLYVYAYQWITLQNDISSADSAAEELGNVRKVDNNELPNENFEASQVPLGAKIYRWNGNIYVTSDGHTLEKYVEDIMQDVDTIVPGTFIATKQGDFFWPDYAMYGTYSGIFQLKVFDETEKDYLGRYKTGDRIKVAMTVINDLDPPVMRYVTVTKDNTSEAKLHIERIKEECEKYGLTLIE